MPQAVNLVEHVFSVLTDEQKIKYLWDFHFLKTVEDSRSFQKFICNDQNINLMEGNDIRQFTWHRFWNQGDKSNFTRKINEKFQPVGV
jgi:hypothetical protein